MGQKDGLDKNVMKELIGNIDDNSDNKISYKEFK